MIFALSTILSRRAGYHILPPPLIEFVLEFLLRKCSSTGHTPPWYVVMVISSWTTPSCGLGHKMCFIVGSPFFQFLWVSINTWNFRLAPSWCLVDPLFLFPLEFPWLIHYLVDPIISLCCLPMFFECSSQGLHKDLRNSSAEWSPNHLLLLGHRIFISDDIIVFSKIPFLYHITWILF